MKSIHYSIAGSTAIETAKYKPQQIGNQPREIQNTRNAFQNKLGYIAEKLVDRIFVNWHLFQERNPGIDNTLIMYSNKVIQCIKDSLDIEFKNESFLSNPGLAPIQFDQDSIGGITFSWNIDSAFFLFMVSETEFIWSLKTSGRTSLTEIRMIKSDISDIDQSLALLSEEIHHIFD